MFTIPDSFWITLFSAFRNCSTKPLLVGISGPPASGKTTLAQQICSVIQAEGYKATSLTFDGFHYSIADLKRISEEGDFSFEELLNRRGSAVTFDGRLASEKFELLKRKEGTFVFPTFDHAKKDPAFDFVITPSEYDFVIVEGLYVFLGDSEVVFEEDRFNQVPKGVFPPGIFDFKIRVVCAEDLARNRLIQRNGRSVFDGDFEHARIHAERNDLPNGRFVDFLNDHIRFDFVLTATVND
jgi:pantothenate kinase